MDKEGQNRSEKKENKESQKDRDSHIDRKVRRTFIKRIEKLDQRAMFYPEEE